MASKILVIEDDKDVRETIVYVLEEQKYEVISSDDSKILKLLCGWIALRKLCKVVKLLFLGSACIKSYSRSKLQNQQGGSKANFSKKIFFRKICLGLPC